MWWLSCPLLILIRGNIRSIKSHGLFENQMIRSCYVVVAVGLYTLDCVVGIEAILFQDLLVDRVIERHKFLLGKETFLCLVCELAVPRMLSDVFD